MSQSFTYKRKFIILKDEMTTISGVKPKGHGKIEVRGSRGYISLNVDNGEANEEYKSYLIGEDSGNVIEAYLGRIFTNERGKGQIKTSFNINNVKNTNISLGEFNGLLIRRNSNVLLSAYIDKNDGLLSRYIVELQEKVIPDEIEKTHFEPEIEEIVEEEKDIKLEESEKIEIVEELETEEVKPDEIEEEIVIEPKAEDLIPEELEKVDIESKVEEIEIEDIIEEIKDDIKEEEMEKIVEEKINTMGKVPEKNYEDMDYVRKLNYKNRLNNYVLSILKFFPYINPFDISMKGYDWWRIEYDDVQSYRGFLPFSNYLKSISYNHPFMNSATSPMSLMKEYNHYIFGMYKEYDDVLYYIYGVPGRFISAEHPYRGVSGFNTWFEGKEDYGYWLIYIEPITGKVLFPLNPMKPLR